MKDSEFKVNFRDVIQALYELAEEKDFTANKWIEYKDEALTKYHRYQYEGILSAIIRLEEIWQDEV